MRVRCGDRAEGNVSGVKTGTDGAKTGTDGAESGIDGAESGTDGAETWSDVRTHGGETWSGMRTPADGIVLRRIFEPGHRKRSHENFNNWRFHLAEPLYMIS